MEEKIIYAIKSLYGTDYNNPKDWNDEEYYSSEKLRNIEENTCLVVCNTDIIKREIILPIEPDW
jgi:hypothetical protein